jgi:type IV secretory pathway VirB2 component (pilin)
MKNQNLKKAAHSALGMLIVMAPSQAFAGTSSSTMGSGLINMLDEVIGFLTGPLVLSIATIVFIAALIGAYFAGGQDAAKKVLVVAAITAGIIAAPSIMLRVTNAAGALV